MHHEFAKTKQESIYAVAITLPEVSAEEPRPVRRASIPYCLLAAYTFAITLVSAVCAPSDAPSKRAASAIVPSGVPSTASAYQSVAAELSAAADGERIEAHPDGAKRPTPLATAGLIEEAWRRSQETQSQVLAAAGPVNPMKARDAPAPAAARTQDGTKRMQPQFNGFEAMVAIDRAAMGAGGCLAPDDPRPVMSVAVTFANSGRVKKSEVESGPYQNTVQGACIARVLRSATIKPFEGSPVTVHRSIQIR